MGFLAYYRCVNNTFSVRGLFHQEKVENDRLVPWNYGHTKEGARKMKYYLRMEGVNLHSFVYDTKDLSTVRGGGLLLLRSAKWVEKKWGKGKSPGRILHAISTGASSGLFSFEAEDNNQANAVQKAVARFLRRHLQHATFVVDVQKTDSESTSFVHDREAVLARNRWRQLQQPTVVVPEHNNDNDIEVQVCHIDWVRPAMSNKKAKGRRISYSVGVRRSYGQSQKQDFYASEMEKYCNWDFSGKFVNDLKALTDDKTQGNLHHKMAVIYLDGNGFGRIQTEHCPTENALMDFDTTMKLNRANALKFLLKNMDKVDDYKTKDKAFRLETLLWGGDEIIWVVPAWKGWEVLSWFYKISQDESWMFDREQLTHAGGLVFCHHNAPIHRIVDLSKALAEAVKKEIKKEIKKQEEEAQPTLLPKNLFQYLVLESYDHVGGDLEAFRKIQYPLSWKLSLNGTQMQEMTGKFLRLKENLPRRQVIGGVHAGLMDGRRGTKSDFHQRFVERLTTIIPREVVEEIARDFVEYFGKPPGLWLHLAELWDYIPEETP